MLKHELTSREGIVEVVGLTLAGNPSFVGMDSLGKTL